MLISYPVLPASAIHDDEDIYLANILEGHLLQHEGRYPVSTINTAQGQMHRWHGGVHLFGGGEPIRAIADGTVVACRFTAQRETYEGQGDYDTGFVLLRHETQTGENTSVVFYSLYMHLANQADLAADRLSQLPTWLRQGPGCAVKRPANQRVWRKDVLGFAGQLYNREAMHFEVFMLDADFNRVWRDSSSITQGTGSDDWFGDAHFVIPAHQQFADRHPRAATTGAHRIDFPGQNDFPLPLGQAGQNDQVLFVSVNLSRGRRTATTYRATADGSYERLGPPVPQDDYEYELYRLATAMYPDCPSAGLEWLRFGRVLGPDTTTRNENWQLVRYSEAAIGYINLAPNGVAKLSDADFPHWLGWEKRDEGETAHAAVGICDDERTLALSQAADEAAVRKLRHLVCKAPSEWDSSDLANRYGRLREPGQSLENAAKWTDFEQHVAKLAFWADAGMTDRSVWHFHPMQFIRHFRQCGWLSEQELAQCIPRVVIEQTRNASGQTTYPKSIIEWQTAISRARTLHTSLNHTARKYGISGSGYRWAAFLGNSIQETIYFSRRSELGGPGLSYAPWYGRGLMQLTHETNYRLYGDYRGWMSKPTASFRDDIETDIFCAADSAGFYWISCAKPLASAFCVNRYADQAVATTSQALQNVCSNYNYQSRTCAVPTNTITNHYPSPQFEKVARAVNTGNPNSTGTVNGLIPRTFVHSHCISVLCESFVIVTLQQQRS